MKLKSLSYLALGAIFALTGCRHEGDNFADRVFFTGTENSPVVKFLCDGVSATAFTVSSTGKTTSDVHITVKAAPELLEAYNAKYNKAFVCPPAEAYTLEGADMVIKAGTHMSTQLKLTSDSEKLEEGKGYMLPITITEVSDAGLGVIETSRTAYVQFTKVITIKAGFLNGSSSYEIAGFKPTDKADPLSSPVAALGQMTIEMKIFPLRFGTNKNQASGISTLCGCEENFLFRFGDGGGQPTNQLELVKGCIGDAPMPDDKEKYANPNIHMGQFDTGRWIHFAAVYDGSVLRVYRDCKQIAMKETKGGKINLSTAYNGSSGWFDTFTIGSSCHSRFFNGYISECRVWSIPRTAAELENSLCYVDPTSEGLIGCWRFDGETNADGSIRDVTGHGYDATMLTGQATWVENQKCPY